MTANDPIDGPSGGPSGEHTGPGESAEELRSGRASASEPSGSGSEGLSRRQLIGLLVGAVAVAAGGSVSVALLRGEPGGTDAGVDEDGLVAVGLRAQQVLPERDDAETLVAALELPGGPPSPDDDAETLEQRLTGAVDRIQDDYATGDTITIDGWVLSLTEARLCALIALAA